METNMTHAEFATHAKLTYSCGRIDRRLNDTSWDDMPGARHFQIVIKRELRVHDALRHSVVKSHALEFSQGSAHTADPTLADVLECLQSDTHALEYHDSFESWASEYGYDEDSRKAEKIYKACLQTAVDLKELLGDDLYTLFLECEEDC